MNILFLKHMAGKYDYQISLEAFSARYIRKNKNNKEQQSMTGGMSTVLQRYDSAFRRDVVVKLVQPQPNLHPNEQSEFRKRFFQEAFIAMQLNHPNMVPVYEFGIIVSPPHAQSPTQQIHPYMVMEYVDGCDFRKAFQHAKESSKFSLEKLMVLFDQICDPFEWAHEKGVIHRDIKPGNVLLSKTGKVAVCDWGIAKIITGGPENKKTSTSNINLVPQVVTAPNMMVGTLAYITPEQLHGLPVSPATDVFLLGALLYEAIVGKAPYSYDEQSLIRRQARDDHRYDMPNSVPRPARDIITKAMQPEPEDRYQDVTALRADVRTYLTDLINKPSSASSQRRPRKKGLFRRLFPDKDETAILPQKPRKYISVSDVVKEWVKPKNKK